MVGVALGRFDRQVEGMYQVFKPDRQIREVCVDDVIAGMVLVDEGDGLVVCFAWVTSPSASDARPRLSQAL